MQLSHLNALLALDATLRHGSFSLAAKELRITPAAVGQRVRLLELYLGKRLFVRSGTGIEPIAGALRVGDLLTDGFARLAEAFEQLRPNGIAGHLHITLPESFSENWLSPIHADFHLQYGNTTRDHWHRCQPRLAGYSLPAQQPKTAIAHY